VFLAIGFSEGMDYTVTFPGQATGQIVRTLPGHTDIVRNIAISRNGSRAAS
jgi:hypothetical protein